MKVIKEEIVFNIEASSLWEILSDVTRCDWVPSVEDIEMIGDCRVFQMDGMGTIKEKILLNDNKNMILKYSAIETAAPLNHHLATMEVKAMDNNCCKLHWKTEIDPEMFADAVHNGMLISIEGIKKVLENNSKIE